MMTKIYSDSSLNYPLTNNILFEGTEYFLDVSMYKQETILKWITEEQIENFIEYHPRNIILCLKFVNIVGFVNILGEKFDIRSEKLFDGIEGQTQFQTLLDEIVEISTKLTFSFKGTAFGVRKNLQAFGNDDLELLDYFYQLAFTFPYHLNLESLLNQCIAFPNDKGKIAHEIVKSSKSKSIPVQYLSDFSANTTYINLKAEQSLSQSLLVKKVRNKTGKNLFPESVLNRIIVRDFDTRENQFLKFFLLDINQLCRRIKARYTDNEIIRRNSRLLKLIDKYLGNNFFHRISTLTYLPNASSVLLNKLGYREIYYHFIQSKFVFQSLLNEQKNLLHNNRLKNIATLYEIWVFFKIASVLFKNESIRETFTGRKLHKGSFIDSYIWQGKSLKLFYNKTYTRAEGSSYSISMNPDISLELSDGKIIIFDAKYKFRSFNTELNLRINKSEDIHKMHTYLDAIPKAFVSLAVYPGTEITFYDKSLNKYTQVFDIMNASGVGAIPLVPNHSINYLEELLFAIKSNL